MSSHIGMVVLVIVGALTVLSVIIAAIIESIRTDNKKLSPPNQKIETSPDKKK